MTELEPTRRFGRAQDGEVIEISSPAGQEPHLDQRWPAMGLESIARPSQRPGRTVAVRAGAAGALLVEVDGLAAPGGWDRVESELALFSAERLTGLVAVHSAGVVVDGRVLMLPGPSGVGKSSLCVAAVDAGLPVITDEYVLVDAAAGVVIGWRRPVRVRRADGGVDRLDLVQPSDPLPVGLVAVTTYQPGAAIAVEPVPSSEAVMRLLADTVCARSRPDDAMDAALSVARSSRAVVGPRGEAAVAIRHLASLLAQ